VDECLPACAEADFINLGGLNHDGILLRVGYAGTFELALWQRVQLCKLEWRNWEHIYLAGRRLLEVGRSNIVRFYQRTFRGASPGRSESCLEVSKVPRRP
jgi:hypothetical protein